MVYGKQVPAPSLVTTVHDEALTIGYQNNMSTNTTLKVFSDLRAKFGKNFVTPGLKGAAVKHNRTGVSAISNKMCDFTKESFNLDFTNLNKKGNILN